MEQLSLSEPEAFRWIQKTAMDLRLSMRQVADGVVEHGPGIAGRRPRDHVHSGLTATRGGGRAIGQRPTPRLPGSIRPGAGRGGPS